MLANLETGSSAHEMAPFPVLAVGLSKASTDY
jgi:hypothetical protein